MNSSVLFTSKFVFLFSMCRANLNLILVYQQISFYSTLSTFFQNFLNYLYQIWKKKVHEKISPQDIRIHSFFFNRVTDANRAYITWSPLMTAVYFLQGCNYACRCCIVNQARSIQVAVLLDCCHQNCLLSLCTVEFPAS